ncbi:hypothetical protein POM88_033629 [Heracleum sosnowskyi]|uniref:protein-disulfide reductase n=1 Tax=Heracleum sosnowskyi TaxID=360622 RepID=A0AAD8HHR1_9APIA|nr:hypothetical protein POM88_033629 [Heracleum sosnowskyi]
MPMPSLEDVAKKEEEDFKKLAGGIWSIKPVALNVSPGDMFPLEYIFLNDPEPSVAKNFEERCGDKYVCIFLLPMSARHTQSSFLDAMILKEVYEHIQSSGGEFEQNLRIDLCTPFPHVNTRDDVCLERIARIIGLPEETTYVIIDRSKVRKVVSVFDNDFLHWHGAEAYPFTPEKIQQLALDDKALLCCKYDLRVLLSTHVRDFVISNDCTKVPISDLQKKTVCLLFYEDNLECKKRTEELRQVYETRKDFEVVVVFALTFGHDTKHLVGAQGSFRSELKFWKVFSNMPWLALPFDDPKCRQLWRIFNRTKINNDSNAPKLIIINSNVKYFAENGFHVLEKTRFENYPFTGKKVVQTALAVRGMKLSSVLGRDVELLRNEIIYGGREHWGEGQEKYTISELFGASIVFLFIAVPGFSEFLSELKFYHSSGCQTISRFEVVYISMTESSPSVDPYMLVSPSYETKKKHLMPLFTHFFREEMIQDAEEKKFTLALVTFGPFGHYFKQGIISTTSSGDASQLFVDTFPFMDDFDKEFYKSQHIKLKGNI